MIICNNKSSDIYSSGKNSIVKINHKNSNNNMIII